MRWIICCLSLTLVALGAASSPAAAPPTGSRNLSLAEASRRSLEHAGFRLHEKDGFFEVSLPGADALEAERVAAQTLHNAEVAYWNLYGARQELSARNETVASARATLHTCESRRDARRSTDAEVRLARKQYNLARKHASEASEHVGTSERQLGSLMSLSQSVSPLLPGDSPTLARARPEWGSARLETLSCRVEIRQARKEVRMWRALLTIERASRALLGLPRDPVRWSGSGFRLTQPSFVPCSLRQLADALQTLKDQELKAQRLLGRHFEQISISYEQIRANRAQREAFAEQLRVRQQEFTLGHGSLDILLEAQRSWSNALSQEHQAIVTYNNSLAGFAFARGATLARHKMSMEQAMSRGVVRDTTSR
jgi:outer membrane protein TolC